MIMKNETALITGSTSGIGKKIAEIFLREGCKVAICSRKESHVNQTLADLKERFGDSVIGAPCDVSDPTSLKSVVDKIFDAFGSIRVLVANAGLNLTYGPFEYIPVERVNSDAKVVIGTNLIGVMNSVAAVLPQMIQQGYGRIITLGGGGAERPIDNMTIYSASKGGVLAFSKCLAEEFKKTNRDIKINIFFPGMIDTNLNKSSQLIEAWKNTETYKREMDLILKYVANDIEESCSNVIPYALPTCKSNGKAFKGYSNVKLVKGFIKLGKELKQTEKKSV